jgi:pimeloyl-ACP methyl ester carboxylesterase
MTIENVQYTATAHTTGGRGDASRSDRRSFLATLAATGAFALDLLTAPSYAQAVSAADADRNNEEKIGMTTMFENAVTKTAKVEGTAFVYREIGEGPGIPILFLHHLTAVLEDWDPAVIDGLGQRHRVIIFDNRGVGGSEGRTPDNIADMAKDAVAFIDALGLTSVDLVGFSMGGFIAQVIAHDRPDLIRRVILAGTGPAGGEGISGVSAVLQEAIQKAGTEQKHPKHFLFFSQTRQSQQAADAFLQRLSSRKENRDVPVSDETIQAHLTAIKNWGNGSRSERLNAIKQPVLVVNGDNDIMVPTINSVALSRALPNAELSIFPNAGHGGIFQYHREFVEQALRFFEN